jgi:RimJ/RimL family protein N-acetyltransferase
MRATDRGTSRPTQAGSTILRTPSLELRQFLPSDALPILILSQEQSLRTWIPNQVYRDEREAADTLCFLIAQYAAAAPCSSPYVLAACLAASGELVGHVGFSPLGDDVEVGYAIAMAHQGRGLATECVSAAVPWALGAFGLPSVVGVVAVDNAASCKVLKRSGFVLEREGKRALHGRVQLARQYRRHAPPGSARTS